VGFPVGADQSPGAVEHGGGVVEIGAIALGVGENHSHLVLARGGEQRLSHRIGKSQEMLLVILDEPVGKERRKKHLGKADDVDPLARSLLHHRAGGLDCFLHAVKHWTCLCRGNRKLSCHRGHPPLHYARLPAEKLSS
jgi:hypothetical protein